MAAQRGLAALLLGHLLGLEVVGQILLHDDIGHDTLGLDRPVRRRIVAGRRQAQRAVGAKRDDRLHGALAERARAHDHRALVVLKRAGHDFGSRSRAAVDQDDDLLAVRQVAGLRVGALHLLEVAALGEDDGPLLEERIGDHDRLVEQTAGIVAQVDDVTLELLAGLRLEVGDLLVQARVGLLAKGRDLDVDDIVLEPRLDRIDDDAIARDLHVEGIVLAFAHDGDGDRRADGTAHLVDGLLEGEPRDLLVVDVGDEVARHNARFRGRRIVDRRHDLDDVLLHRHLDAETAELAARSDLHIAEVLRIEVGGMRVEA